MMIVNVLGSDSGFGLGTDGIIDDYDDETGISVILWCIIFLFLLIVTIWFYITQLMPNRNAKCGIDDDAEDEDERVANRLLDQLGTKPLDKSNDEPSKCEPSTSREDDYEVIDAEITIHYSNYECESNTDDYNDRLNDPQEMRASSSIPRRPSMEEMSLIFPGFLPRISEEEEFEENSNEEIVYHGGSCHNDTSERNANIFIEHESSNEYSKSDHKIQEDVTHHKDNANTGRVVTNRKGKQPIGYVSTEVRRRHIQNDFNDKEIQRNDSLPRDRSRDNESLYVQDSELETAVFKTTATIQSTQENKENVFEFHNKIENNFISGDPVNQTNTSGTKHDLNSLIIISESTVALETLSPDANENTNLNTTDKDTPSNSSFSSSFSDNAAKNEQVPDEKVNEIIEKVKLDGESSSEQVYTVPLSGNKLEGSYTMEDKSTHSWTFYAMSDTNSNIENYLEDFDRTNDQKDIPEIVVDFCPDGNQRNCNIVEHNDNNNAVDSFETDIDVDDIDLDELEDDNNAESDDLNCFVKRHVSVTDLDKILNIHDISFDITEQYDISNDSDLDELMHSISDPTHKTNKETTTELSTSTGDPKIVNESNQNPQKVLTGDYIYSYSTMISDQVSSSEDCMNRECDAFTANTSRSKQNVPAANKQQHSINIDNVDTLRKTAIQSREKYKESPRRDSDEKKLEMTTHVENCINTDNKDKNDYNTTINETTSIDTKQKLTKTTKVVVKKEVYSYRSNVDNVLDSKEHRTITTQEDNHCHSSSIDSSISDVKNNDCKDKTVSCSTTRDTAIITDKNDRNETASRAPTEKPSTRSAATEQNVGLTAEELSGKIDLSKPVYTSSRNEVIIGRKKNRKDSASRFFTSSNATETSRNATSSNATELSRKLSETSSSKSEPSRTTTRLSRSKSEPSRRAVDQALTSRNSETSRYSSRTSDSVITSRNSILEQTKTVPSEQLKNRGIPSRSSTEQTDAVDVTKIPVAQSSDVKQPEAKMDKSNDVTHTKNWTTKVAKTRELQTLISIKDIPDSRVGVQISTTKPLDALKMRKTSTGLEKAEEIIAKRMKRLEEEKKNGKVHEDLTPISSNSRQIDWDNFLIDGRTLQKVDNNTREKKRGVLHSDIPLTPPLARKPIVKNNEIQVCENYTQQFCNPREIDWDWFEHEENSSESDNKDIAPSHGLGNKDISTYDNVKSKTVGNYCANLEHNLHKSENNNNCDNNDDAVVTNSVKDKGEHYSIYNGTAGALLNDSTTVNDNNEENLPTKHDSVFDDNDVFSSPSYPSSAPEFPVRLTKSFSELRNIEMLNQSRVVESNFQRPDRSKSQTDVFAPQGFQDDVFDDAEDHVFKTRITVDEVYNNRRRIVILNVRKKSPGKTRWKSLSDLESAKRHVYRFKSIGSHSELAEEKMSAGDDLALFAENKDSDFTLSDKAPTSLPRDCYHSNDASLIVAPSCKRTEDPTMENTVENYDLTLQSQPSDFGFQRANFKTIEQRLQEEDLPSQITSSVDVESTPLSSDGIQLETVEPKLCYSVQSQDILNAENSSPCYHVSNSTESEVENTQLQQQPSLSPVQELTKQATENRRRSPGNVFAVSSSSATPLVDRDIEKSLQRLPSPPTTLPDIDKQDGWNGTSLSGTVNVKEKVSDLSDNQWRSMSEFLNNSADGVKRPEIETSLQKLDRKKDEQNNSYSSKSETVSARNEASMTSQKEAKYEKPLERQSSLSPVHDITVRRSPSPLGTYFAVRGQSPTPLRGKDENSLARQSSLSPVQDHKDSKYGTIFAVSRHSPTPLSDVERKIISEKVKPASPVQFIQTAPEVDRKEYRKDYYTTKSMTSKNTAEDQGKDYVTSVSSHSRKPLPTDKQSKECFTDGSSGRRTEPNGNQRNNEENGDDLLTGASYENKLADYNKTTESLSRYEKYKDERPSQKTSSISPELTETSLQYTSRHSSASSSGYGGSRISPSSSVERRYTWEKPSKPSLSTDLVSEQKTESNSRRSSASSGSVFLSRVSPTPSTDSEYSNIDYRRSGRQRSQRSSNRSGTVFAISGYSSGESESRRPGSVSPRESDQKHSTKHATTNRESNERHNTEGKGLTDQTSKSKEIAPREIKNLQDSSLKESPLLNTIEKIEEKITVQHIEKKHSIFDRVPSSESDNDFGITQDGWLVRKNSFSPRTRDQDDRAKRTYHPTTDDRSSRTNDQLSEIPERNVLVTDLDSLINGTSTQTMKSASDEKADLQLEVTDNLKSRAATTISPTGLQETDLDAIFDSDNSSSKEDNSKATEIPKINTIERSKIIITSVVTSQDKHTVKVTQREVADCNSTPSPMLDDLDEDIFTRLNPKHARRDPNDMTFSSDADSETSSLNSVPVKSKVKHTKASLEAVKSPPQRISQSSDSSSATPSTPEKVEPQFMFLHPDLTSTPEVIKATDITKTSTYMTREATKEPSHVERQDNNVKGNSLLKDSSYGAVQVKTRSTSDTRVISTEASKSAFTPVRSRTNDRRPISQEYIQDSLASQDEAAPNYNAIEESAFKDLADSHKSMPDLHTAHDDDEVVGSPKKTVPYHSRLSAHTRLWLSQTAGIDTSDLCKDESGGSEIFLFPSKRFQPGKNVDASFLSIASEGEDIPDNVSSRPSSPMSEFSFAGDSPFGAEPDNELRIIACGHRYCDQEEIIRGQDKTTFTTCPACYTYYCSRECRQAHWKEHKKFCYFGRINSYMRSFIYFCHKKENLRLLLSNIAIRNYATKGRGSVMVTFASPKQARKFMTSGCVLLPSPPSYSTVRELMQEGVVSKHKVNLVHQVKDYDPTKEFVLNLAVVAGRLEDLPRHPVPRHKLNTVLECIKVPLSESISQQPKNTVPDTSKETRVFYLPKCSRHGFINDMEARRHYCRNISKSLKSYGIRLKKDYPEAYECLCMYVEKNKSFKPLTVYGNEGSKIITCKIMPEASISAV